MCLRWLLSSSDMIQVICINTDTINSIYVFGESFFVIGATYMYFPRLKYLDKGIGLVMDSRLSQRHYQV